MTTQGIRRWATFRGCTLPCLVIVSTTVLVAPPADSQDSATPKPPPKRAFAQFVGVVHGQYDGNDVIWPHISFARHSILWYQMQPNGPDDWDQQRLENWGEMVLRNRRHGVECVPCLQWTAPWAARTTAWSYTMPSGRRYQFTAWDGKDPAVRQVHITDPSTAEDVIEPMKAMILPPEKVEHWENFVDRVVSFLSKSPYNVRYFQIWNEAYDNLNTGFWLGSWDEYLKLIHLPAARIIRRHGGKVVYGGYPNCGSGQSYVAMLNRFDAWHGIDVLDTHYLPLSAWQYIHDHIPGKHKHRMGLWQTEVGHTTSRSWVPNYFPRFFHWAISHDDRPHRYMIFQFAYEPELGKGPYDPDASGFDRCFLTVPAWAEHKPVDHDLSHHGKALVTLGGLLNAPDIRPYGAWKTSPALATDIDEGRSSVEGFDCGDRIVLAIHLTARDSAVGNDMKVSLPEYSEKRIARAWRIGIYGSRLALSVRSTGGKGVMLRTPVRDEIEAEHKANQSGDMRAFYIVLELRQPG